MTTRKSDPDGWYDPDDPDGTMLRQIRKAGEYRRSDPPPLRDVGGQVSSSAAIAASLTTGESVGGMDVPATDHVASLSASGTSPGLSPCPFCGAPAQMVNMDIICLACSAGTRFVIASVTTHAARLWNARAPAPVPEGMETTPQSRALILSAAVDRPDAEAVRIIALLRDLDRALAEIARLTAVVAMYENPTHCKIDQHFPDRWPCPRCGEGPCRNAVRLR